MSEKPSNKGADPMDAYYRMYNPTGRFGKLFHSPHTLAGLLQKRAGVFEGLLRKEFEGKQVMVLLLGSATPRNIEYLQDFLTKQIKVSTDSDVLLIDNHPTALDLHKKHTDASKRLPRVHVVGADMTQQPIPDRAVDIAISDYTVNFLQTEEDLLKLFGELGRVLSERGRAVLQLHMTHSPGVPTFSYGKVGGVDFAFPNVNLIQKLLDEAGLEIEIQKSRAGLLRRFAEQETQVLVLRRKQAEAAR